MQVSDEKVLLRAKEGQSPTEIFLAIQQVLTNCLVDSKLRVADFALFDIEYLFLKLRAMSVSNKVTLNYEDKSDPDPDNKKHWHQFEIDLDTVEVKFPDSVDLAIPLGSGSLKLKYPKGSIYASKVFTNPEAKEDELFDALVSSILDAYYEGDEVLKFSAQPEADVKAFINALDVKTYQKIKDFLNQLPALYHEIKYKDSVGTEKTLVLSSLLDFFSF
jgi:hypothetical protein